MTPINNPDKTATLEHSGRNGFVDLLVFLLPCLQFLQVKLVGRLSGSDILIVIVFLFLLIRRRLQITTNVGKWLIALCSLWLASQCLTDIVRRSPFGDYARGWSGIGITIACLSVLWTLIYGKPHRIAIYGWGLVVGSLLTFFTAPTEGMDEHPWKFGLARPITLAVFLLISRPEFRKHWPVILSFGIGILNVVMGSRSQGGICLAASLYLMVTRTMQQKNKQGSKIRVRSILVIAASIILGFSGILWTYQYAASTGLLGDDARSKFERQSSGRYGIILGGRMDALGAFFAIYDSPILGHGSWAKDPKYLIAQEQTLALLDYKVEGDVTPETLEEGLIPSHSHILGAWVDAGILGALFWGWAWFMTAKRLARVHLLSVALLPLASFSAFQLLWDLLFSGYGAEMRVFTPYYIVTVLSCLSVTARPVAQVSVVRSRSNVRVGAKHKSLNESIQT